jgi:hypothetical protein
MGRDVVLPVSSVLNEYCREVNLNLIFIVIGIIPRTGEVYHQIVSFWWSVYKNMSLR